MAKIAPSILAADFARLAEAVQAVANADAIHVDVMDGHFVPNITLGPDVVAALRRETPLPLDVHLMIEEPGRYLEAFAAAGADRITVHVEACRHLHSTLASIGALGKAAGVALNPATPASAVKHVLHLVDLVLVMTVNPGFGGQRFLPEVLPKVSEVAQMCASMGHRVEIQVDGGIGKETIGSAARAGATFFVAGTAIFRACDPAAAVEELRRAAAAAAGAGPAGPASIQQGR